jgi:hypothetical protein
MALASWRALFGPLIFRRAVNLQPIANRARYDFSHFRRTPRTTSAWQLHHLQGEE